MNFLTLDDVPLGREGEVLDPDSILVLPFHGAMPVFPEIQRTRHDAFLRAALFDPNGFTPLAYCHGPIVVRDPSIPLGDVIGRFRVHANHRQDDVLDEDVILLWTEEKRIPTGPDVLGYLLRGIVRKAPLSG